jgi:hypothetical protein
VTSRTLCAFVALVLALGPLSIASAQGRSRVSVGNTQGSTGRILTSPNGPPASPLGRARLVVPSESPPRPPALGRANDATRRIIIPGRATRDNSRRIVLPGQAQRDHTRRIIVPGRGEPRQDVRGPLIVSVAGSSVDSMARALRSVGEHRLAASLCRQSGGCSSNTSVRSLTPSVRRGATAVPIRLDTERRIYDARHRTARDDDDGPTRLPRLYRADRDDPIARRAYDKAGVILAFYRTVLGRQSFDDRNSPVRFVVHYGEDDDNAAWYSADASTYGHAVGVFGDGDEHSRPQIEGDIAYHEFTHGVVDETAALEYEGESGALHEHFADALAETAQQWERGESVQEAEWLFGEGTFHVGAREGATRSFADPGLHDQPGHVGQVTRHHRENDNGGVHALAGIPNRAFHGAATRLGGHSWEHVGVIWYAALRDFLGPRATFRDAATATVRAATELFGERSRQARAVRAGWADVGIRVPAHHIRPGTIVPSTPRAAASGGPLQRAPEARTPIDARPADSRRE